MDTCGAASIPGWACASWDTGISEGHHDGRQNCEDQTEQQNRQDEQQQQQQQQREIERSSQEEPSRTLLLCHPSCRYKSQQESPICKGLIDGVEVGVSANRHWGGSFPCSALSAPLWLGQLQPFYLFPGLGNLQPWMQGLIAVAVYLVLVAVAFAVNRFWCQEKPDPLNMVLTVGNKADGVLAGTDGRYSSMVAGFRSAEHKNAYENFTEEEGKVRSTPM
ncbi:PDZK1-interacting protein 1 [Galemys pyrenaicus]|uniref:PDZK1-interacting protein 1 n=1 Tax=Galemys pyrenaicus TaxID=202257 RepID=A0A8J6DF53_GALPY|nr:PDZK1-interacting protein 1 [Galemys pyrenaicus]